MNELHPTLSDETQAHLEATPVPAVPVKRSGPPRPEPMQIEYFTASPFQPRHTIDLTQLAPLVASIKRFGFLGHIEARFDPAGPTGGRLQLVYGHRRLRAAELAGLRTIPTVIVDRTDEEMQQIAFIENDTAERLNFWEEATFLQRLQRDQHKSITQMAEMLNKSRGWVQNRLDVLRLPENSLVRQAAMAGEIDLTSAITLLNLAKALSPEEMDHMVGRLQTGELIADDLKKLRKAYNADMPLEAVITDSMTPAQAEAAQMVLDEISPPGPNPTMLLADVGMAPVAEEEPVLKRVDDRTVFRYEPKDPAYYAHKVVEQFSYFVPSLRESLEKADLTALDEDERTRLAGWRAEINLLVQV